MKSKKKKKISIDLDVVTVGLWEKKDPRKQEALEMLKRIKNKEFFVISLSSLLKLPEKWRNKILAKKIADYYFAHTDKHVDDVEIFDKLKTKNVNVEELLSEFLKKRIKEEDIFLVLTCSLNSATLITMNRKHLRGNEKPINEILEKFGLKKIKIRYPRELELGPKKKTQRKSLSSSLNLFKDSRKTALFISSANFTGSLSAGIETFLAFFFIIKHFVSNFLKVLPNSLKSNLSKIFARLGPDLRLPSSGFACVDDVSGGDMVSWNGLGVDRINKLLLFEKMGEKK